MIVAMWILFGLAGASLLHMNWKWYFDEPRCPSPAGIIKCVVASAGGPVIFIVSLLVWIWDIVFSSKGKSTWWNTPICKGKSRG